MSKQLSKEDLDILYKLQPYIEKNDGEGMFEEAFNQGGWYKIQDTVNFIIETLQNPIEMIESFKYDKVSQYADYCLEYVPAGSTIHFHPTCSKIGKLYYPTLHLILDFSRCADLKFSSCEVAANTIIMPLDMKVLSKNSFYGIEVDDMYFGDKLEKIEIDGNWGNKLRVNNKIHIKKSTAEKLELPNTFVDTVSDDFGSKISIE